MTHGLWTKDGGGHSEVPLTVELAPCLAHSPGQRVADGGRVVACRLRATTTCNQGTSKELDSRSPQVQAEVWPPEAHCLWQRPPCKIYLAR
jgi:hypothetical protein